MLLLLALCLSLPMFYFFSPLEIVQVIFTCLLTCTFFTGLQVHVTFTCTIYGVFPCTLDICSCFFLLPTLKIGFTQVPGLFPLTIILHQLVTYTSQAFDIILCLQIQPPCCYLLPIHFYAAFLFQRHRQLILHRKTISFSYLPVTNIDNNIYACIYGYVYTHIHTPDNCTKARLKKRKEKQVVAPVCQAIVVRAKQAKPEHTQARQSLTGPQAYVAILTQRLLQAIATPFFQGYKATNE